MTANQTTSTATDPAHSAISSTDTEFLTAVLAGIDAWFTAEDLDALDHSRALIRGRLDQISADSADAPTRPAFVIVGNDPAPFEIDEAAFERWIASNDDVSGHIPTRYGDQPASDLTALLDAARGADVFTGDPRLELLIDADNDPRHPRLHPPAAQPHRRAGKHRCHNRIHRTHLRRLRSLDRPGGTRPARAHPHPRQRPALPDHRPPLTDPPGRGDQQPLARRPVPEPSADPASPGGPAPPIPRRGRRRAPTAAAPAGRAPSRKAPMTTNPDTTNDHQRRDAAARSTGDRADHFTEVYAREFYILEHRATGATECVSLGAGEFAFCAPLPNGVTVAAANGEMNGHPEEDWATCIYVEEMSTEIEAVYGGTLGQQIAYAAALTPEQIRAKTEAMNDPQWRVPYAELSFPNGAPTDEDIVDELKEEFLTGVRDGIFPADITDFGDLHAYCDANMLADTLARKRAEATGESWSDFFPTATDRFTSWLATAPAREAIAAQSVLAGQQERAGAVPSGAGERHATSR